MLFRSAHVETVVESDDDYSPVAYLKLQRIELKTKDGASLGSDATADAGARVGEGDSAQASVGAGAGAGADASAGAGASPACSPGGGSGDGRSSSKGTGDSGAAPSSQGVSKASTVADATAARVEVSVEGTSIVGPVVCVGGVRAGLAVKDYERSVNATMNHVQGALLSQRCIAEWY